MMDETPEPVQKVSTNGFAVFAKGSWGHSTMKQHDF